MPATPAWLALIEALLNRGVESSTEAAALARRLDAKSLDVVVEGVTALRAGVQAGRISLVGIDRRSTTGIPPADAAISGTPIALLMLARGAAERPSDGPKVGVSGDAEVANLYRQLLSAARPDFEEELSRLVGDVAAHRLSNLARTALSWGRRTRRAAGENIAEYLQEESRDVVGRLELEEFLKGVDAARETADRVAARIARLEQLSKG
jgi:ubiquinone biosynthesis protein UbiJ